MPSLVAYVNSRAVIFGGRSGRSWHLFSLATPFLPPRKQFHLRHVYLFRLFLREISFVSKLLGSSCKEAQMATSEEYQDRYSCRPILLRSTDIFVADPIVNDQVLDSYPGPTSRQVVCIESS
jgi:hypothetical protein